MTLNIFAEFVADAQIVRSGQISLRYGVIVYSMLHNEIQSKIWKKITLYN